MNDKNLTLLNILIFYFKLMSAIYNMALLIHIFKLILFYIYNSMYILYLTFIIK